MLRANLFIQTRQFSLFLLPKPLSVFNVQLCYLLVGFGPKLGGLGSQTQVVSNFFLFIHRSKQFIYLISQVRDLQL